MDQNNKTTGNYSIVSGGRNNTISNNIYSTISGGYCNTITSDCSGILGGDNNYLCNTNSFIIGKSINTNRDNTTFINNLTITQLPTYVDNSAALGGGLNVGDVYRTSTGDLKIVY